MRSAKAGGNRPAIVGMEGEKAQGRCNIFENLFICGICGFEILDRACIKTIIKLLCIIFETLFNL
jgi:hypothetical protein